MSCTSIVFGEYSTEVFSLIEGNIPTTRAAHLLLYCDILDDIGTPLDREIERAGLPVNIAETPDALVNNVLATTFVGRCAVREGVEDLGWLGASHFALSSFTTDLTVGLKTRASVKGKLRLFKDLSALEDSHMEVSLIDNGDTFDLACDMRLPTSLVGMSCGEWVQLAVLVEIVRSVVGPLWTPLSFNFRTRFKVADGAREAFPNSRFRFGQQKTSITVESGVLGCCQYADARDPTLQADPEPPRPLDTLKKLIRPYLSSAAPSIEQMAEMSGTSTRSFQRWLAANGTSYSHLLQDTRAELAKEMLSDYDVSVIEIALSLGYENQSNFGRSFRKATGVTPAAYRRGLTLAQEVSNLTGP